MEREGFYKVGDLSVPYRLTRNGNSRHVRLKMRDTGLQIVVPTNLRIDNLESLLAEKQLWIEDTFRKLEGLRKSSARQWVDGETVYYMGAQVPIKVISHPCKDARILLHGDVFEIYVSRMLNGAQYTEAIENAFEAWLEKAAERLLAERLKLYSEQIGVRYNQVRIKKQKTRWGSCSQKANLNFNWRLVMAPLWIVDYVVIHELCHLRFLNHSRDFWQLVAMHMPEYKKAITWLKMNGNTLNI